MTLIESSIELTTSATDAVLAIECVVIMVLLRSTASALAWRVRLWRWVFGLLAISYFLGALAHGIKMQDAVQTTLWKPVYLSLGIAAALFIVGAVADWRGWTAAKLLLPWGIGAGIVSFGFTQLLGGEFITVVVFEALALVVALGIYTLLFATNRLRGAGVIALAILLSLSAAAVQVSDLSLHLLWSFDHNGLFHLVQMLNSAILWLGVSMGMESIARRMLSEKGGAANGSLPIRAGTNSTSSSAAGPHR